MALVKRLGEHRRALLREDDPRPVAIIRKPQYPDSGAPGPGKVVGRAPGRAAAGRLRVPGGNRPRNHVNPQSVYTLILAPQALVKWLAEHRRALLRDDYARLVSAFRALDVAGRGYLEPGELRAALGAGALSAAEVTDLSRCRFRVYPFRFRV